MNLTKEQIENLTYVAENGDNAYTTGTSSRSIASDRSLLLRLLDGKVLIDRWNNVTRQIIFNTIHEKFVNEELSKNKYYYRGSKHDIIPYS